MGGFLDHKELKIIKGIGRTPGDTNSAEPDSVVVNLMAGAFSIEDWSPNIPAVKGGGVWADSPISDGRVLLASPVGNVTESLTINITDSSYLTVMNALSGLNKMVADCRDFWQTESQIDPVYLSWWAGCGVGLQYALLYNIELKPTYQDGINIQVNMTLERESAWRMGVPPGGNPKIWTYYINPAHPQFNMDGASLVSGSDHLLTQTIQNKFEWTPAAAGLQATPISQNYISISASQVPGDAPALVELAVSADTAVPGDIFIARSSKKISGTGHDGVARTNALILNVGDGNTVGTLTKTVGTATTGVKSNGSSANFYYGTRTSTGISPGWVVAAQWGGSAPVNGIRLDRQFMRGSYAIFCRAVNRSAAAPVLTDMKMRVVVTEFEDNANQYLNSVTLPEVNPQLTVTYKPLNYMGIVTIPFENKAVVSPLGYGIQLQESNSNIQISLQYFVNVATANRTLEVTDLILMPIDECMVQAVFSTFGDGTGGALVVDNTGYLTRGKLEQTAIGYITNANSGGVNQELRGQDLTLVPRTDQRLYFIGDNNNGGGLGYPSQFAQSFAVRLNITPRCMGIRTD